MREIDFLPDWYPAIHRRHRWVIVQAWVTVSILMLLTGYAMAARWRATLASRATAQTETQVEQSQLQLAHLAEKVKYEQELRHQDEIVAKLGIDVDTTRLLRALEDAMSPDMALTAFSLETIEQPGPIKVTMTTSQACGDVDRRLRVSAQGIAPTDMEVASMMERLQKAGCFENVAFPYLREGPSRDGHLMREFEVTFEINLNPPAEAHP